MRFLRIIIVLMFCFISQYRGISQTRVELENQRKEANEQLKINTQLLNNVELSKRATTQKIQLINNRIRIRQGLIQNINNQVNSIEKQIAESTGLLEQLNNDLELAKVEYGRLIYYAFKFRSREHKLMYIMAAENINQAYRRTRYFQQINQFRRRQIEAIHSLNESINNRIIALEGQRNDRIQLLREHRNESNLLSSERKLFNQEVSQLSRRERELREEISRQRRIARQLEEAIKDMIAEEARRAAERKEIGLSPAEKIISDEFRKNQGGLPWPTERGVIVSFFGENPHPVLRGIMIRNNGIDILTSEGAMARSIFKGEVRKVIHIPRMNTGVIIRHGNFLSVYTNLSEVFVKVGDKVDTKESIGRVFTDRNAGNKTQLHLEVWEENKPLDPIVWISR